MNDDDYAHSPYTGCSYQKCGLPGNSRPCPFVAAEKPVAVELPKYLPGQVVMIRPTRTSPRLIVFIERAEQLDDDTWEYRSADWTFHAADIEKLIRTSSQSPNRGGWQPE
jgi:hypothetical protein